MLPMQIAKGKPWTSSIPFLKIESVMSFGSIKVDVRSVSSLANLPSRFDLGVSIDCALYIFAHLFSNLDGPIRQWAVPVTSPLIGQQ